MAILSRAHAAGYDEWRSWNRTPLAHLEGTALMRTPSSTAASVLLGFMLTMGCGPEPVPVSPVWPATENRLEQAAVLVKAQRLDEAAVLLGPLLTERPDDAQVVWLTAYTAYHRGRHNEAATLLDEQLDHLLAAGRHDALLMLGTLRLAEDPARARDLLEDYVVRKPDHPAGHSALGRALAALGDDQRAREHLDRALGSIAKVGRELSVI
jgi:predicted Zn-dependent protease